ncbi:MAG: hypothetical protein ACRDWT_10560 [Jatrophihabitantaceae bacterium]
MSAAITGGSTVEEFAGQAAEAVRALNHSTRPGIGALTYPAELDTVVADLAALAGRLPQLLAQLGRWLHTEQRHGRLRVDSCSPHADCAAAVAAATEQLTRASDYARHAGRALDGAHQILAHLAANDHDERIPR